MSQSDSSNGRLSQDVVFDLLSSPRRRFVLYYLRRSGGAVELGELADEVAAWENETTVEELTSQQRKRVYVSLYQTHIPKLEDVGIVDYDSDSGLVTLSERASDIGQYLADDERELPWQLFYLGLVAISVLFYLAVSFDAPLFGTIDEFVAGVVILLLFALLAVVHYLYVRYSEPMIPLELIDTER